MLTSEGDPSERLEELVKKYVLSGLLSGSAQLRAPEAAVLKELASLSGSGIVRDLNFTEKLVHCCSGVLSAAFTSFLDAPAAPRPAPPKPTGAVNCCGPSGSSKPQQPPMGMVAPWAGAGNGGQKVMPGAGRMKGGWVAGAGPGTNKPMTAAPWANKSGVQPTNKPMTVAPWMNNPGSSVQSTLAKAAASNNADTAASEISEEVLGAVAACNLMRDVLQAEECAEVVPSVDLDIVAALATDAIQRLCNVGSLASNAVPAYVAGAPSSPATLREGEQQAVAKALKGVVVAVYSRFLGLRAGMRRRLSHALLSTLHANQSVPRGHAGVRLHALDGGGVSANLSLVGLAAALEVLAGVARGFRRPLSRARHLELLWDCMLPMHAPTAMVDDRTPLLELFHRPLCLGVVAMVEVHPQCVGRVLRGVLAQWPASSTANSSKEVLLLHELEMLLEHCPPEGLGEPEVRDMVLETMTACFAGSKNFRVAERSLMMFQSDSVVSLLRHHQEAAVRLLVPRLKAAAGEHWNESCKKMIGLALGVLDEMNPENFQQVLGAGQAQNARETAVQLNPPRDRGKEAEEAAAREGAMVRQREADNMNLYSLAMGHDLGQGAYSRVRFAKLIAKDLVQALWPQVAVKIQDRAVIEAQGYEANVEREIAILKRCSHPAIVRFVGSFSTANSVFIALEYMPKGDLQQVLAAKGSLSLAATSFVAAEVVSALEYLHSVSVVYGDLKPENVLLDDKDHAKLSDFGSSRIVHEGDEAAPPGRVEGTAEYIAPEVAAGKAPSSFGSDAWALGCVVFQLLAGRVPVLLGDADGGAEADSEKLKKIVKFSEELTGGSAGDSADGSGLYPTGFPIEAKGVVGRLLSVDPGDRLGGRGWGAVKDDAFFEGLPPWESLATSQAPSFTGGMVSAAAASDRNWNRRKQSMMYSPMPDKYAASAASAIPLLPEEPDDTPDLFPARASDHTVAPTLSAAPAPSFNGGLAAVTESEAAEEPEEGSDTVAPQALPAVSRPDMPPPAPRARPPVAPKRPNVDT